MSEQLEGLDRAHQQREEEEEAYEAEIASLRAEVERLRAVPTYEQAITHLRGDESEYVAWLQKLSRDEWWQIIGDRKDSAAPLIAAAFLSARLTEGAATDDQ